MSEEVSYVGAHVGDVGLLIRKIRFMRGKAQESFEVLLALSQDTLREYLTKTGWVQGKNSGPYLEGWVHSPTQQKLYLPKRPDYDDYRTLLGVALEMLIKVDAEIEREG